MALYMTDEGGKKFETHPAGPFAAVCADVIDMGVKPTAYGLKRKVRFVFLTEWTTDINGEEKPGLVMTTFNWSLAEKSTLRGFLEGWRGRPFTEDDLRDPGFDVESLIGVPAMLNITHTPNIAGGGNFANVDSAARVHRSALSCVPDLETSGYVRVIDRSPEDQQKYLSRFQGQAQAPAPAPVAEAKSTKSGKMSRPARPVDEVLADTDDDLPF